jgi:hypothetical protein
LIKIDDGVLYCHEELSLLTVGDCIVRDSEGLLLPNSLLETILSGVCLTFGSNTIQSPAIILLVKNLKLLVVTFKEK